MTALIGDGEICVVAEVLGPPVDDPRLEALQQHRHVGALDAGQHADVGVYQVGQAMERLGTLLRGE